MRAVTALDLNVRTLIGQHKKLPCIYTHAIVSYSQLVIKKSKCKLILFLHATQRKSAKYAISQSRENYYTHPLEKVIWCSKIKSHAMLGH